MNLDELAIKHGTDKSSKCHNYTAVYENMFGAIRNEPRDKPLKILEIGVATGASLRMWEEYFSDSYADVWGIDINPECAAVDEGNTTSVWIGDATDRDFLDKVIMRAGGDFDIVIDDGSHRVEDQIFTFKHLWPNTKMVYVIEDVYSSYLARYGGGYRRSGTAVEFFKDLVDDVNAGRLFNMYKSKGLHLTYKDIGMIQFYPSLVCLYKGK